MTQPDESAKPRDEITALLADDTALADTFRGILNALTGDNGQRPAPASVIIDIGGYTFLGMNDAAMSGVGIALTSAEQHGAITPPAKAISDQMYSLAESKATRFLDSLSPEQREEVTALAAKMADRLGFDDAEEAARGILSGLSKKS